MHRGSQSPGDAYSQRRLLLEQELRYLTQSDPSFAPHAASAFEVKEELGRGGMGLVQRVRDRRLDREAALKVLLPEACDEDGILRFRREAWVMAYLEHPSIPAIFESGRNAEGRLYILMQLVRGETLEQGLLELHKRSAALEDCREFLPFLLKASEAVAYAHSRGILHRDLKPSNLILGDYGELTVVDWGLAQALKSVPGAPSTLRQRLRQVPDLASLTQEGSVLGTPGYLSPEQARGEEVDERADVYALGAILTRVLTGRVPVAGKSALALAMATMNGQIKSPSQIRPGLPPELDFIAAEALAFDQERRTPSAELFTAQLRAYLLGRPVPGYPYSRAEKFSRWARRRGVLIAWLVFFLAVSAVGSVFWAVSLNLKEARFRIENKNRAESQRLEQRKQAQLLFSRAQARFGEFKEGAAFADLEAALDLDKDSAELRYDCARLAYSAGLFSRALVFLDGLPAAEKSSPRDLVYRYEIAFLTEARDSARVLGKRLVSLRESRDPYAIVGRVVATPPEELDRDRARKLLAEALREVELVFLDYQALLRLGDDGAERRLFRAVSRVPRTTRGLLLRAKLLLQTGREDYARVEVEHAILRSPRNPECYLIRAQLWTFAHEWEAARRDIDRARSLDAKAYQLAQSELGLALGQKRFADADEIIKTTELEGLSHNDFKCLRAVLALERKRPREALEALGREAAKAEPESLEHSLYIAAIAELGQAEEAARLLSRLTLYPVTRDRLNCLTLAALKIDRPDLGLSLLEAHGERFRFDAAGHRLRARCLNRSKRYQEEIEAYSRALELEPFSLKNHLSRGMAYLDLREVAKALKDFNAAVLIDENSAEAWRWRMFCHYQLGRHFQALQDWEILKRLAAPKVLTEYAVYAERSRRALKSSR